MSYKLALITGASSGIGAAFARALPAETGLLLTGRDDGRLAATAASVRTPGRRVETLTADLAAEAGRQAVLDWARDREIDLLINNAGLGAAGPFAENAPETEHAMVTVNVLAPVVLSRGLLPGMIARARAAATSGTAAPAGVIVVASVAGFQPVPFLATYAASKAFDLHFAEALAYEMKDEPVDVLALCPGATETDFFARTGMNAEPLPLIASPDLVARRALAALGRDTVCFPALKNRLSALLGRHAPKRLIVAGAGRAMRGLAVGRKS